MSCYVTVFTCYDNKTSHTTLPGKLARVEIIPYSGLSKTPLSRYMQIISTGIVIEAINSSLSLVNVIDMTSWNDDGRVF